MRGGRGDEAWIEDRRIDRFSFYILKIDKINVVRIRILQIFFEGGDFIKSSNCMFEID